MHVQKTVDHHGKTLAYGEFDARETVHVCPAGCRHPAGVRVTRRAMALTEMLIPRSTVGYDVLVFVGLQRFLHCRRREEIRDTLLSEHGLSLSTGAVSHLTRRFLEYLHALHDARTEPLRAALAADGGWPLHIDATGENGRGTLLVAYAGWRRWVLGAWKIPTEHAEAILPRLRQVVHRFGAPCAVVRDLGPAMIAATAALVAELGLTIPVLACHYHFLRDIGRDLLDADYSELRELFRRGKARPKLRAFARELGRTLGSDIAVAREDLRAWQAGDTEGHVLPGGRAGIATVRALAQWVLDYAADSSGEDYPFDRPYLDLYDRCCGVRLAIDTFMTGTPDRAVTKSLERLRRVLDHVVCALPFEAVTRRLRRRATIFDELRDAVRLMPTSSGRHTATSSHRWPPERQAAELCDIEAAIDRLTASLQERRPRRGPAQDTRQAIDLVLEHLERHGQSLWGHVIPRPVEAGGGIRLVERTNNLLETFFRDMKHMERRRSGRKVLTHDLECLPAAAVLARNLAHPDYVAILCGSLDRLAPSFAALDEDRRRRTLAGQQPTSQTTVLTHETATASLPAPDRRLVRSEGMHMRLLAAACGPLTQTMGGA